MNNVLKVFLSMSLSGSLLILILFSCKQIFKDKISRQWQYYIWLIVIMRLLLPFTPETNLMGTIFQTFDNTTYHTEKYPPAQQNQDILNDDKNTPTINNERSNQKYINKMELFTSNQAVQDIITLLVNNIWIIWLVIALILFIRKITIYQSFVRYIKAGQAPVSDTELLDRLAILGSQIKIKRAIELCINPLISSPLLIGFFRPCIVLPRVDIAEKDFQYIVLHELTHYRRFDMLYKWLVQITVCLHWFNPLVYLMGKEINKACEFACDEAIVKKLDSSNVQDYGKTLLNSIATVGKYKESLASVTLSESKKLLKERLGAIMNFRKKSNLVVFFTIVITVLFTVGATAIGAYTVPQIPVDNNKNKNINSNPTNNNSNLDTQKNNNKVTDNTQNIDTSSSGKLPDNIQNLDMSFDIYNGGLEILPSSSNEIKASYDGEYYDVHITKENGKWIVRISGKVSLMGKTDFVKLYVPNVKRVMNVKVRNGDFSYNFPTNCTDIININAANAGIQFTSKNKYDNSKISLTATDKNFLIYDLLVYPNYFTKTDTGFKYKKGTEATQIAISLTGYTDVEFK
ncbi:peptidase, M56 family protein [Clostridioides difficile]|nr:peptidase, M56 family protein [Clostridioides difficile]NJK12583.1 peptidase, M56 family protein [Clostridioides difficile]